MDKKTWWYLSFAEEAFNGGCFVQADDFLPAVSEAYRQKCSPGGQVMGFPVPEEELPDASFRNRLLTEKEIKAIWPDSKSINELGESNEKAGEEVNATR